VALSSIGLVATLSTLATVGTTSVPKIAISTMKIARKSKLMPKWLISLLKKESKIAKDSKNLKHIEPLLGNIHQIYKNTNLKASIHLLSHTTNYNDLRAMVRFSKRFGKDSLVLKNITKNTVWKNLPKLQKSSSKSILLASTYGKNGISVITKVGEKAFLRNIKLLKGISKSTYRGNIQELLKWILKNISNSMLWSSLLLSIGLLLRVWRVIFIFR